MNADGSDGEHAWIDPLEDGVGDECEKVGRVLSIALVQEAIVVQVHAKVLWLLRRGR